MTALPRAGIRAKAASAGLGHSNIAITMDLYTPAMQELDEDAAENLGLVISWPQDAQSGRASLGSPETQPGAAHVRSR